MRLRQFYIDREFDRFPLHHGIVRRLPDGKAEIWHDWLAGIGEATFDSELSHAELLRRAHDLQGRRHRVSPNRRRSGDRRAIRRGRGEERRREAAECPRHRARDASAPRRSPSTTAGRSRADACLLGNIIPYDDVWRTGANAATQFSTSAPITLAGIELPPGTYTLWTVPREKGAELIVNKQTGQWGTEYDARHDLGTGPAARRRHLATPVEKFTISIVRPTTRHGTLVMEWGPFRWTAPIMFDTPEV